MRNGCTNTLASMTAFALAVGACAAATTVERHVGGRAVCGAARLAPVVAAYTNAVVSMTFDAAGRLSSLRELGTGRELVSKAVPFVEGASSLVRRSDGSLEFATDAGRVVMGVTPFGGLGWTFTFLSAMPTNLSSISFANIAPVCTNYVGKFVNALSDRDSFVALRCYECESEMHCSAAGLSAAVEAEHCRAGLRVGLAAGPRSVAVDALRAMTVAAGVPRSDLGGAWSLGSEGNRESYFFHFHFSHDVDALIDNVRRSGATTINLYSWWQQLGRYEINRRHYPGGWNDFSNTIARIHAAGLKVSLHTLTGCISTSDRWVTPVPSPHLMVDIRYTLAEPISAESTALRVAETPDRSRHDFVFTYAGRGNVLRIGDELIQYSGIDGSRFTGLVRGAFGTKAAMHAAGDACGYLHQIYRAFYPDPDSPLADDVADCIARAYNGVGADQIYFDGSEGMGTRYAVDTMRRKIFSRLDQTDRPVLDEASHPGANNWWFHSRLGAWDSCYWAAKRFHDHHHSVTVDQARKADFISPQLGWWYPKPYDASSRGHFLDEAEYFASRNAGADVAMSLQGLETKSGRLPSGQLSLITVIGWYERARLARAFKPEIARSMGMPGSEFRLRQGTNGVWTVRDSCVKVHRVAGKVGAEWQEDFSADMPAALRVEALFGAEPYASTNALAIFSSRDVAQAEKRSAAGVSFSAVESVDAEHGATTRLEASNSTSSPRGAWAGAVRRFPLPYKDIGARNAFCAWVKGDGSGAILNIQATSPREYIAAFSEHYVKLDFTGWRYVTLLTRERDTDEYVRLVWPYGKLYQTVGRNRLNMSHVDGVGLWLNEIPPGRMVRCEVGEVRAVPIADMSMERLAVTVNGKSFALPFSLKSGDYAELEDGCWTRYDRYGEPVERAAGLEMPCVRSGSNEMGFSSTTKGARAEITIAALGKDRTAFTSPLSPAARRRMDFEYEMPVKVAPRRGFCGNGHVAIRPGEKARIRFGVTGDAKKAVAVLSNGARELRVGLPGETQVLDGTWKYRVECPDANVDFRLEVVKSYDHGAESTAVNN